jgi:hypothetical protein
LTCKGRNYELHYILYAIVINKMKRLGLFFAFAFCVISCGKKKLCADHISDEVWLVIEDTVGTNLLDSKYLKTPSAGWQLDFERVVVNNETVNQMAWKVDFDKAHSNTVYQLHSFGEPGEVYIEDPIGADFEFIIEFDVVAKNLEGCRKKYSKGKLNWMKFEDTTFYGPGIHTYIEN